MTIIEPQDLVLMYFQYNSGDKNQVIDKIDEVIHKFDDVYSPIDIKYYEKETCSDVIETDIWYKECSKVVEEKFGIYGLTEYGKKISPFLMKTFKERYPDIYEKIDEEFKGQ